MVGDDAPIHHRLEFPCYFPQGAYDERGFLSYPELMGWEIDVNYNEDDQRQQIRVYRQIGGIPTKDEVAAFLQAWLAVGLLTEVMGSFGIDIRVERDFVRLEEGGDGGAQRVFTLILLDRHLEEWGIAGMVLEKEELRRRIEVMTEWLKVLEDLVWEEEQHGILGSPMIGELPVEVLEPMQVLAEVLEGACEVLWRERNGDLMVTSQLIIEDLRKLSTFETPMRKLPAGVVDEPDAWYPVVSYERMLSGGWCPSEVRRLLTEKSSCWYLYYASTLRRHVRLEHNACSPKMCQNKVFDEAIYTTKHCIRDCGCSHVDISPSQMRQMCSILQEGRIPRISLGLKGENGLETLSVLDEGPYVAFSHVWSDGLGNVKDNSLPTCQLVRLHALCKGLQKVLKKLELTGFPFWIDTLCVPLQKEARKLALRKLGEVYEKAEVVLVLDNELLSTDFASSDEEIGIRICESNWMRRLWTLEEGLLGRSELLFQFRGKAIPMPTSIDCSGIEAFENDTMYLGSPGILTHIGEHLFQHLPRREVFKEALNNMESLQVSRRHRSLLSIVGTLRYRETSKQEDETLCIASILGFDLRALLSHRQAESRMKAFLILLQEANVKLSQAILFSGERKLSEPGFRWAPFSLMTLWEDQGDALHPFFNMWTSNDDKKFTDRGLCCTLSCYYLHLENIPNCAGKEALINADEKINLWREWIPQSQEVAAHADDLISPKPLLSIETQRKAMDLNTKLAIVLNPSPQADAHGVLVMVDCCEVSDQSLLPDGYLFAEYICRVRKVDPTGYLASQPDSTPDEYLTPVTCSYGQHLCIG